MNWPVYSVCILTCGTGARVDADSQPKSLVWTMTYFETRHFVEEIKRHVGNLDDVSTPIWFRKAAYHHVGVADGLHLSSRTNGVC